MQFSTEGKSNRLPIHASSLIGRQKEIAEIHGLLLAAGCHLVTLVGPGGIGKTALAVQAAGALVDHFDHGVYFVPLQPVQNPGLIATAIAHTAGISFAGVESPLVQVCNYLHEKATLLVLDNFEHLLDGVGTITTLLEAAPALKILVTSREALNLREEWLYPVQGLRYPHHDRAGSEQDIQQYSAVQLFVERTKQGGGTLVLAEEGDAIVRICQLVEGMPLALELAATWTKTLPCRAIAAEIQKNLDFLTTRLRDVPDRHRSIQAVFDHSWRLLTAHEQAVFMRLCVFRGGFTLEAATAVADASLSILSSLVDKSLVNRQFNGRYQVHELLRQFAQDRLAEVPAQLAQTRDRHCAYYADFLHAREAQVEGGQQQKAALEVEVELDNIRAAWAWAVDHQYVDEIVKSLHTFGRFDQFRSRYREGAAAFEKAIDALDRGESTPAKQKALAMLLVHVGWLYIRLGQLETAERVLQRSQAIYDALRIPPLPGPTTDPLAPLGVICLIKGDYSGATEFGERSRQGNAAQNHHNNLQFSYYVLIGAALAQGDYERAHHYVQQAYNLAQQLENHWFMAYCLNELGQLERALGHYASAAQHFYTSYRLRQEFNDPEGMAVALAHLGQNALLQKEYATAREFYRQSHAIYHDLSDRGGLATTLEGLGATAHARGDYTTACQHFREALELAVDVQFVPRIFSLFIHSGELLLQTGKVEQGLSLLTLALHHPASTRAAKERAADALSRCRSQVAPDIYTAATQAPRHHTLEAMAAQLLSALSVVEKSWPETPAHPQPSPAPAQDDLSEPLTQREREVLALLAQGLTNRQIAQAMVVSIGTVKAHNHSIFSKLGVNNRALAVARARELRLIEPPPAI